MNVQEDFIADGVRYTHRIGTGYDIYFVSNRTNRDLETNCIFRIDGKVPELWDPLTGEIRKIQSFLSDNGKTIIPMKFNINQSFFIVFRKDGKPTESGTNYPSFRTLYAFKDEEIKYYSGTATYHQTFELTDGMSRKTLFLDLGKVGIMAKVWLNDKDVGTVWTNPYQLDISKYVQTGKNKLTIEVVNTWVNRLIHIIIKIQRYLNPV